MEARRPASLHGSVGDSPPLALAGAPDRDDHRPPPPSAPSPDGGRRAPAPPPAPAPLAPSPPRELAAAHPVRPGRHLGVRGQHAGLRVLPERPRPGLPPGRRARLLRRGDQQLHLEPGLDVPPPARQEPRRAAGSALPDGEPGGADPEPDRARHPRPRGDGQGRGPDHRGLSRRPNLVPGQQALVLPVRPLARRPLAVVAALLLFLVVASAARADITRAQAIRAAQEAPSAKAIVLAHPNAHFQATRGLAAWTVELVDSDRLAGPLARWRIDARGGAVLSGGPLAQKPPKVRLDDKTV